MKRTGRSGFTLAEMLVVIAIILILAALLVPAAFMALGVANTGAIAVELGQLDSAMKQYKVLFKSYPPNSNPAATVIEPVMKQHIQLNFGRSNPSPPFGLDPGETLVFWLQGFSNNPLDPLDEISTDVTHPGRKALMDFDKTRLVPTRQVTLNSATAGGNRTYQLYHYYPVNGQQKPYIYFNASSYGTLTYPTTAPTNGKNLAKPYFTNITSGSEKYANPESYQIISAGLDGDYGDYSDAAGTTHDTAKKKLFPTGTNYTTGDKDNVTNFSGGALGSKVQ